MGIYDRDIEWIISNIGEGFQTVEELRIRMIEKRELRRSVSFVSQYVIDRFIR